MDLDKLEKLSCLNLPQEVRLTMEKSLEGVFQMMHNIDNAVITEEVMSQPNKTEFRQENDPSVQVAKNEANSGLLLEDGYFLAPKVINK